MHTLGALPDTEACRDCLRLLGDDDALLLLGDGVHAAAAAAALDGVALFVLAVDAAARGVTTLPDSVTEIDMAGFVELTERFSRQVAWY